MQKFKDCHPVVNFTYFVAVLGFSMVFMHPALIAISLLSGFSYSVLLGGRNAVKTSVFMLPLVFGIAALNPIFNHEGMTILAYLPSGNPLTMESVVYGISEGVMLMCILCHFSCFNEIMTSDKLMCLFGKIIPSLSLIFSMELRFVPRFKTQLREVKNAQHFIGRDLSKGGMLRRAKNGIKILSIMLTWCLENGIDTADSMKSRGFGLHGRTSYSNYRWSRRDIGMLLYILILSAYVMLGGCMKVLRFNYFPVVKGTELSSYGITVIVAYAMLFLCPIIIEIRGIVRWEKLKSKI